MRKTITRTTALIAASFALVAVGYSANTPAAAEAEAESTSPSPVTVSAVHEESGELAEVKVTDEKGEEVEAEVEEKWRGNEDAEDGLYEEDPAAVSAPEKDEDEAGETEVQKEEAQPEEVEQESEQEDAEAPEEEVEEEQVTDEYMGLEPWYTDDGSGAVVLIVYSDDDERAVEDVFVIVNGEQIPVDHLDER